MVWYSAPHSSVARSTIAGLRFTFCLSVAILLGGTSGLFTMAAILSEGDVDVPNGLIGINSVGYLTVNDGSTQNNAHFFNLFSSVGVNAGSNGSAIVTGAGSTWENKALLIGESGTGQLEVSDGRY